MQIKTKFAIRYIGWYPGGPVTQINIVCTNCLCTFLTSHIFEADRMMVQHTCPPVVLEFSELLGGSEYRLEKINK